jgi:formylglycine-generating enzyme required for sulfatase activity
VVGVSWFEARAYARWLAGVSGRAIRLPLEAEWEAAARGSAGWRWPWGNDDPTPGRINNDDAHLRRTSPVGVFPAGDGPTGLTDLAGNVWEWTLSEFTDALDADALTREAPDGPARRVLRGGAWDVTAGVCRAGSRGRASPGGRGPDLGFRVVCCPIFGP